MRFKLRTQLAFIFTVFSITGIVFFYFYTINLQRKNFREDFQTLHKKYVFTDRGEISIKGKGNLHTYFIDKKSV